MSTSIFTPATKLIEQTFKDGWSSRTPVKYENVMFEQPLNASWVALYIRWSTGIQASIGPVGTRIARHAGVIVVQIFTPKDKGKSEMTGHCDFAAAIFRMSHKVDAVAGIEVELREPELQDAGEEKNFLHKNLLVPFQLDGNF